MSEPAIVDRPGVGGVREVRVERDGQFVCIKRQIRDLDQFQTSLTLDPESALALVMELCGTLVEIRKTERAVGHGQNS